MKQTRILFDRMPKMLLDILGHVIASEREMVIAGRVADDENLLTAVRRTRADVILVRQAGDDERRKYATLLFARPKLRIVAIARDGSTGLLYELRPQRIALGRLSADALRRALREQPLYTTTNAGA